MHPAIASVLRYFEYSHLKPELAELSKPFHDLAHQLVARGDLDGPELTVALRKLLESKDAAVRAALPPAVAPGDGTSGPQPGASATVCTCAPSQLRDAYCPTHGNASR